MKQYILRRNVNKYIYNIIKWYYLSFKLVERCPSLFLVVETKDQVEDQLKDQVEDQLEDQLKEQIENLDRKKI